MRQPVTRIFFYDAIPSLGTNCLKEAEWDPETGAIYHSANGKQYVCSFAMVREMTIVPVAPAVPVSPAQETSPVQEIAKVVKPPPVPDPLTGVVRRKRS